MIDIPKYKALEGCSTDDLENTESPPGFYPDVITANVNAARIACCSIDGSTCSRKYDKDDETKACINNGKRASWEKANLHCLSHGLRLCKSQEELNKCCGTTTSNKCNADNRLVWTGIREGIT